MRRIRIIADDKIPFLKGVFEDVADISYFPGDKITREVLRETDALIIRTRTICNRDLLEGTSVKFIASATIGYDHIDTDYCKQRNIRWTNAPGCNAGSVEQYILSVLLNWCLRYEMLPSGLTLGILGVGNVGTRVARAAENLGMKVLLNDPPRARIEGDEGFVAMETIAQQADIITFHVPLNLTGEDITFHLAGDEFFSGLSKKPFIINSSRGEVVDEAALFRSIASGRIKEVCLDVWENEPCIRKELLDLINIATPHIAGYSTDGKANGTMMSVRAVSGFFGLGLENWSPSGLPLPDDTAIAIDCSGMRETEILGDVYLRTYDVRKDDEKLREDPDRFEDLRGCYPLRREPGAYSVRLIGNPYSDLPGRLESLGFSVLETACFC